MGLVWEPEKYTTHKFVGILLHFFVPIFCGSLFVKSQCLNISCHLFLCVVSFLVPNPANFFFEYLSRIDKKSILNFLNE